jgi:hypothetical protein
MVTFDVPTQTDDSFLEICSMQRQSSMHHSLLSMFTMNMTIILKLLIKIYPSVHRCILTGEFFQLEKQATQDLTVFIDSVVGDQMLRPYILRRESLMAALGCALPRVYFDASDEHSILGQDCIY